MRMRKIFIGKYAVMAFLLLLSFQVVRGLGVTRPIPVNLKLLRGDTARFYFQIQAVTSSIDQVCTYSVSGLEPLQVNFDEKSVTVEAGKIKNIYGTRASREFRKRFSRRIAVSIKQSR